MAGRERTIKVTVVGDASSLRSAFGQADGAAGRLAGSFKKMAGIAGIGAIGLALKHAGEAVVDMSLDFERSMAKIVGLVGVNREVAKGWAEDIKKMAGEVGKAPAELADALYFISSAGITGAAAIDTLNASAKASAAGLGETKTVADAATSAMNAYGQKNLSAESAIDVLIATIREGKAEPEELAQVLGRVIPVAATLGISFDQVGAAVAAMSRLGLDAAESTTALRGIMMTLVKPSKQAKEELAKFGLTTEELREQVREKGLLSVLFTLRDTIGQNDEAMGKIFPNVRALSGVLNLVGENAEYAQDIFDRMAVSSGDLDAAFQAVAETNGFKLQQSFAELKVIGTEVGDDIVPQLVDSLKEFMPVLKDLLPAIGGMVVALMDFAKVAAPLVISVVSNIASAFRGITFIVDVLGDAFGVTDGRAADMARAMEYLTHEIRYGADPAAALANALRDMAASGELTEDQFMKLAGASGLSDERIGDVKRTLLEYAATGEDANVTTDELRKAFGLFGDEMDKEDQRLLNMVGLTQANTEAQGELEGVLGETDEALEEQSEELKTLAEKLRDAEDAQKSLADVMLAAVDPVYDAMGSFDKYREALDKVNELQKNGKTDTEEYHKAQFELGRVALETQGKLDRLDPQVLDDALVGIATALQITKDQARLLLENLGLIDGKTVVATVRVSAPTIKWNVSSNTAVPHEAARTFFHSGGIATGKTRAVFGEAGVPEAAIPLDERGLEFMVKALNRVKGAGAVGGSGVIVVNLVVDGKVLARAVADPVAIALKRREDSLR